MKEQESKLDIIDFIVSEERKKAEAFQAQNNENIHLLDAVNIFKENDPVNGIWNRDHLKVIFKQPAQIMQAYQVFFEMLNKKQKFNTSSFPLVDAKGDKYYYINDIRKNGSTGFKLVWFNGLEELMQSYLFGIYAFNISFEELYHEVNK